MDSVSNIDDLPEDIMENIFHRLPIKTLGWCMCMKKQWLFLIRNPRFIAANEMVKSKSKRFSILWNCVRNGFEMYTDRDDFEYHTKFNLPPDNYIYEYGFAIASCNGLICVGKGDGNIILWNPTIKKILTLPKPIHSILDGNQYLGLGFDSLTDDYKLVRILVSQEQFVEVFSLKTNLWKIVSQRASKYEISKRAVPIANGVVHWLSTDDGSFDSSTIVGFNVNTEIFNEIELPRGLKGIAYDCRLFAHQQLSIAICCCDGDENLIDIWVMKEYGRVESWFKIWTFVCSSTQTGEINPHTILGLRYKGDVLLMVNLDGSDEMDDDDLNYYTVSIDPESGQKKYVNTDVGLHFDRNFIRYFEESLTLLDNDSALSIP